VSNGRPPFLLFLVVLATACASCSSDRVKVYPVTGKVFYQGQPAQGAVVVFHPAGNTDPNALHPQGTVAADGSFRLTTYKEHDGAPPGQYDVTVIWTRPTQPGGRDDEVSLLPVRYQIPATSGLRAQVKPESNELAAFQLTR
jgi:hypothetical protein